MHTNSHCYIIIIKHAPKLQHHKNSLTPERSASKIFSPEDLEECGFKLLIGESIAEWIDRRVHVTQPVGELIKR